MRNLFSQIANKLAAVKAAIVAAKVNFWVCPEESNYPLISGQLFYDLIRGHKFSEAESALASMILSKNDDIIDEAYAIIAYAADDGFKIQDTVLLDWLYRVDSSIVNCWIVSDGTPLNTYGNGKFPITEKWLKCHGGIREYTL